MDIGASEQKGRLPSVRIPPRLLWLPEVQYGANKSSIYCNAFICLWLESLCLWVKKLYLARNIFNFRGPFQLCPKFSQFSFIPFWEKLFGLYALLLVSIILTAYLERYVSSFKLLRKQKSRHLDRDKFVHFHQHSFILEITLFSVLLDNLTPSHPCQMWQW